MSYTKYALIAIIFLSWYNLYSQNDFDSEYPVPLTQKSYVELKELFYKTKDKDTVLAESYAEAFLKKAKSEGDTLKMAKGYRFLWQNTDNFNKAISYADSLIDITKNIKNKEYPAISFLVKGYLLHGVGKYTESLNYYLKAYPYAVEQNNISQQLNIRQAVGAIKNRWGSYEEALKIYREHLNFLREQKNYKENYNDKYLIALYNISICYINNQKIDSASIYINEGIKESLKVKDSARYYKLLLIEGTRLYEKREYKGALDSINKAIPHLKDNDIAISHLYKGKIYYKVKQPKEAIFYLKKVDSLVQKSENIFPDLSEGYQILIQYYKSKNDLKNQLKYIDKFLYVDSIIKNNYVYLNRTISKKYDVPQLISEKQKIISSLEDEQFSNFKIIIYLGIVSSFFFLLFFMYYFKQKIYKKRLEAIINKKEDGVKTIYKNLTSKKLDIDEIIVKEVLNRLNDFESGTDYLDQKINLANFSKELNTNSTYLSKIINTYKGQNFSNYLNELRVDYAISRLKKDAKFRSFTIQAIAEESGFSTSQSFANAFYKKTGIYPSYFLKQLKSIENQ